MNKLLYLIIIIFLSSCGVKGNLYLPQEMQNNKETTQK